MRGDLLYKILNSLEDVALEAKAIIGAQLNTGYGVTFGKLDYQYNKIKRRNENYKFDRAKKQEGKLRIQKYLWKLKKDGLLKESQAKIFLTQKGKEKLFSLKEKSNKTLISEAGKNLILISYDLPAKEKKMRQRLIEILKILGLKMIHQSLWAGKIKIPARALSYFEEMGALKYLEILEVTKKGTLEKIN